MSRHPTNARRDGLLAGNPFGRDDLMAIAAVRYCLGRQSYIVGDCVDWLIRWWPHLAEGCRKVIARDVNEAFAKDDEARECGDTYRPLGMDMDRQQWERARALWLVPNASFTGSDAAGGRSGGSDR